MKIGFIGLGKMGSPMATNLLKAGFELTVYNRTRSKMATLISLGASTSESPRDVAAWSDIIITMVTDGAAVEEIVLGQDGVVHGASPGSVVIDMSSISPSTARKLSAELARAGVEYLDAPVSGQEIGAINATLSIMVGGSAATLERCMPVLKAMGQSIVHMGEAGSGQMTKLCNQISCALTILSVSEALVMAASSGLDVGKVLSVLSSGAAGSWSMTHLGPKIIDGDFASGAAAKLHEKDLRLVSEVAREMHVPILGTAVAHQLLVAAMKGTNRDIGNHAMILPLERMAMTEARVRSTT